MYPKNNYNINQNKCQENIFLNFFKKSIDKQKNFCYTKQVACESGGTGRRARLRGVWATIRVQVPSFAPK